MYSRRKVGAVENAVLGRERWAKEAVRKKALNIMGEGAAASGKETYYSYFFVSSILFQ